MDLTPELIDAICEKVTEGNFPNTAAVASGVSAAQFDMWMQRGRTEIAHISGGNKLNKDDAIFVHLVTQIEAAEAVAESRAVSFWQNHVSENWQAAKEFLSRRYPQRWGNSPTDNHG